MHRQFEVVPAAWGWVGAGSRNSRHSSIPVTVFTGKKRQTPHKRPNKCTGTETHKRRPAHASQTGV